MVRDETESKAIYVTAKEVAKSALMGYERLVPLLQKECDNAKKRIEVAKDTHKTLGAKLLGKYKEGHINYDALTKQTNKLQEKTYYEEFFESRYCKIYKDMKDSSESFKKGVEGF